MIPSSFTFLFLCLLERIIRMNATILSQIIPRISLNSSWHCLFEGGRGGCLLTGNCIQPKRAGYFITKSYEYDCDGSTCTGKRQVWKNDQCSFKPARSGELRVAGPGTMWVAGKYYAGCKYCQQPEAVEVDPSTKVQWTSVGRRRRRARKYRYNRNGSIKRNKYGYPITYQTAKYDPRGQGKNWKVCLQGQLPCMNEKRKLTVREVTASHTILIVFVSQNWPKPLRDSWLTTL